MKKIILIFITVVLAALIICGCEKTDGVKTPPVDPESLAGPFSLFDGGMTFRLDIADDRITIYEDGTYDTVFQTFPHAGVADVTTSTEGIKFEDFTFDGFTDFYFPQRDVDGISYYYGYVWDEENKAFFMLADFLKIGNPTLGESCILSTEVHNGETVTVKYYFTDGKLTHEYIEDDPYLEVANTYIRGFYGKNELECKFTSWELVDNTICRKYYVYEGETVIAAAAVNGDGSRVFYTLLTDVYAEILKSGESYVQSEETYAKMEHTNEVFTYVATGFESLSDADRELYGTMYSDIMEFKAAEYTVQNAEDVLTALFSDHPVMYNYVRYKEKGGVITTEFYVKWAPYKTPVPDDIRDAVNEYDAYTDEIINSIPVGLEPMEKYIFLAQRLQLLTKSHNHEHGEECDEPLFEILISGDAKGERLARTFKYLCEKAQLYCEVSGKENTILQGSSHFTVDLESTFKYAPGSEKWLESFCDID